MNTSLFSLRKIRYRPLSDLTGRRVIIRSLADIRRALSQSLPSLISAGRFKLQDDQSFFAGVIAKYKILDLTFVGDATLLTFADRITSENLCHLGLSNKLSDKSERDDWGLSFMEAITEEIRQDVCFLRVFMDCESSDIGMLRKEFFGRSGSPEKLLNAMIGQILQRFPMTFTISDACLTNCESIWLQKHFYL